MQVFPSQYTCGRLFSGVLITKGLRFYSEVKLSSFPIRGTGHRPQLKQFNCRYSKLEKNVCSFTYSLVRRGFTYFQRLKDFLTTYLHCNFFKVRLI